jgi:hypothetical protein
MEYMKILLSTLLLAVLGMQASAQCNGYPELCGKRFDEVAYAMTHNAYNAVNEGFELGNQTHGLTRQLQDGVRGLMLDIHESGGEIVVYHGFSILGSQPLSENLAEIKAFLDNHPNEIVSIIFETNVSSTDLENELTAADLMSYLHHQTLGEPWPTLQEMINANQRLVVFSESDNGTPDQTWYHYAWAHTFDTPYSFSDPSEFDCSVNRGDATNALYLVNHWISTAVGTGDSTQASVVNANPLLMDRLTQCQDATGRFPNFIGVDFYHIGDVMTTINALNGVQSTYVLNPETNSATRIFPNPAQATIQVESKHPEACGIVFRDILGRHIDEQLLENGQVRINCRPWGKGVYFYGLLDKNGIILESGQAVVY